SPKLQIVYPEDEISFSCAHEDSSFSYKYWYRQEKGKGLILIGYAYKTDEPEYEKEFIGKGITMKADGPMKSTLTISAMAMEHNAVYYCASSVHSGMNVQR
ncbi:TPA: hypothetical protein GDO54_018652, partial [Pyxicephalus adspersus]